jgi:hypothetical protein
MYVQYALRSGDTKVIAELLDCGVDVDAITNHSNMSNALIYSSRSKDLDTVRFLLQRGASTDHVDSTGLGADTLCWFIGDDFTKYSSMDVFDLLAESSHVGMDDNPYYLCATLCVTAIHATGGQVDALVRLGADVHVDDDIGEAAIHFAVWSGNHSTFSALASYYDEDAFKNDTKLASELLLNTIYGRLHRMDEKSAWEQRSFGHSSEHDKIMIDMFQRGVGPRKRLHVADSVLEYRPPGIHYQEYTANDLAAALGPETEAWYLVTLHHCGLLAHGELQRLRELAEEGHVANGFVCDTEEPDEVDYGVRGNREEDGEVPDLGQEDIYPDTDGVSRRDSISEADEDSHFWDAEEVL